MCLQKAQLNKLTIQLVKGKATPSRNNPVVGPPAAAVNVKTICMTVPPSELSRYPSPVAITPNTATVCTENSVLLS